MVAIGTQSLDKAANLFYGDWSHVEVVQDPTGVATSYYLGLVTEGVLEISREDAEVLGTTFPRRVEVIVPQRVGMRFSGQMNELHKQNLHLLLGNLPGEASQYLYPGAQCPDESRFVRFVARRIRCDAFVMEVVFWKAQSNGLISIGSGDPVAATPMEISALDDVNGDFGGSTTAPLGYLYTPDPAT